MNEPRHKQGKMYDNEEDRRNGLLLAKRIYGNKSWNCEICNVRVLRGNKSHHLNSKKHKRNEGSTCSVSED